VENTPLAGLTEEYLLQQLRDMKAGARVPLPDFSPSQLMLELASTLSEQDARLAAAYFSSLPYTKRVRVVEAAVVPTSSMDTAYLFNPGPQREPLGQRIVEGPDDNVTFERRDSRTTYTAYVPVGSIARGKAIAAGKDRAAGMDCQSCHGEGLRGAIGPPVAGRPPSALFRQLWAFRSGYRNGPAAEPMKAVLAGRTVPELIDVAAYVASLPADPQPPSMEHR